MRIKKLFRKAVTVAVCASMTMPYTTLSYVHAAQTINGLQVADSMTNVQLGEGNALRGAIVDQNGKPVAGAPVMIGQQGSIVAHLDTAADGRYTLTDVQPGIYQVASYAGVVNVRVFEGDAPADAVQGVIQTIDDEGIARGQCASGSCESSSCSCNDPCARQCRQPSRFAGLRSCLQNPLLWAAVIAAAIVIPLAIDDDDAS